MYFGLGKLAQKLYKCICLDSYRSLLHIISGITITEIYFQILILECVT